MQPTLFLSHGGGPWPWIPNMRKMFAKTEAAFKNIPAQLAEKPKAIVVISGHWEESEFTVSTAATPPMVYDYSGFPPETYHIKYAAKGAPELANKICSLIQQGGQSAGTNSHRGFDHGTFVPLALMYPDADVPVISLSMKSGYDPEEHLQMGRSLRALREENVLLIGSGLSYHNMRGFGSEAAGPVSQTFEGWLNETIANPEARDARLIDWETAPQARSAHPREDHLIPLMVIAGASEGERGSRLFLDHAMGVVMASYRFGA